LRAASTTRYAPGTHTGNCNCNCGAETFDTVIVTSKSRVVGRDIPSS
jgi:hypothetical protein